MKRVLPVIAMMLVGTQTNAQLTKAEELKKAFETKNSDTVAWIHSGSISLGVNEGFLHNWAAGGEIASMTVNGLFTGNLTRLYHRQIWSNSLDMTYGLFYAYSNKFIPKKTDDRIDFTSKYGVRIDTSKDFYITGLLNFKSQFTKGYDYSAPSWDTFSTSKFLSPAYTTLAIGAEYRKGSDLSLFFSPIAARMTFASSYYTSKLPEGAFGIQNGKTSRFEFGAYFSGRYTLAIAKNMTFKTRLDLYTNYLAKDTKDATGKVVKKDNPGNIDLLWDNLLLMKISKYLNVSLGATVIYDNDLPYVNSYTDKTTGKVTDKNEPGESLGWVQLKQIFTLGFQYKF